MTDQQLLVLLEKYVQIADDAGHKALMALGKDPKVDKDPVAEAIRSTLNADVQRLQTAGATTGRTAEQQLEAYRGLMTFGVEGLKTLFLLSGGSIVAVLAYLGQAGNAGAVA